MWGQEVQTLLVNAMLLLVVVVSLPSATGDNQLAIGVGSNRWITGDSSFNVTIGINYLLLYWVLLLHLLVLLLIMVMVQITGISGDLL